MTLVIGSIQLTITRIQPKTQSQRLQREMEWKLLEQEIEAVRQAAYREAAMSAFGTSYR